LFIGNSYSLDIWREHSWGTLRRLAATPAPLGAFLGARVISLAFVLAFVALAGVAGMRWVNQVPVASVPLAIVWLVLSGADFYLLLVAVAVLASNQRAASVVGNLIVFPLSLLGGSFFPFEMMPDWMASIGRFTPNGWAITRFKALVAGTAHMRDFAVGAACMIAVGSLLFLLTVRRLRRLT
jgi:ABC-type multidrug transport system permease subunit